MNILAFCLKKKSFCIKKCLFYHAINESKSLLDSTPKYKKPYPQMILGQQARETGLESGTQLPQDTRSTRTLLGSVACLFIPAFVHTNMHSQTDHMYMTKQAGAELCQAQGRLIYAPTLNPIQSGLSQRGEGFR